jgi:hypothetical protein
MGLGFAMGIYYPEVYGVKPKLLRHAKVCALSVAETGLFKNHDL